MECNNANKTFSQQLNLTVSSCTQDTELQQIMEFYTYEYKLLLIFSYKSASLWSCRYETTKHKSPITIKVAMLTHKLY